MPLLTLEAEEYVQTADGSSALEYGGAGQSVEFQLFNRVMRPVGAGDLDPLRARTMGYHRQLTGCKGHCAGIKIKSAVAAIDIVEVEPPNLLQKLAAADEQAAEAEL